MIGLALGGDDCKIGFPNLEADYSLPAADVVESCPGVKPL